MANDAKSMYQTSLRVIWKSAAPFKKELISLSILGIISAFGNAGIPYVTGKFFDAILHLDATFDFLGKTFPLYACLFLLWMVIQIILAFIDSKIEIDSIDIGWKARLSYITDHFSHLLELPLSFHKKNKRGDITSKIGGASWNLQTILNRAIISLAPQFLSIIIAFIIIFQKQPSIALILFLTIVLYLFLATRDFNQARDIEEKANTAWGEAFGDAYGAIENVHSIKQSVSEEYEQTKIKKNINGKLYNLQHQGDTIWGKQFKYRRLVVIAAQFFVFIYSIRLISQGSMTLGGLIALNSYTAMIFGPFVSLTTIWQTVQNGFVNLNENEKIFNTPNEIYFPKNAFDLGTIKGKVTFKDVSFEYENGNEVLSGINFEIQSGEVCALVGESGVGKSTLVDLISGFYFAKNGEVLIDDKPINKIKLKELRSQIAVVPQEVVLFNDTIQNNIKYGNFDSSNEEIILAAKKAHAFDFIEKFPKKWEQVVGERGIKLSVGQKQRVSIARAILRNPKILILDEPTSALDAGTEKIITESLHELMKGRTTFIIAHRLSTVRRADKIVVFKDGRIVEFGKHDELLKISNGEYRRLYGLQVGLHA